MIYFDAAYITKCYLNEPCMHRLVRVRAGLALGIAALIAACGSSTTPTAPPPGSAGAAVRVLVFTATAGFRHDNALGHFAATWNDARFRAQILAAVKWTAKR